VPFRVYVTIYSVFPYDCATTTEREPHYLFPWYGLCPRAHNCYSLQTSAGHCVCCVRAGVCLPSLFPFLICSRLSLEDALHHKWSIAMASAILAVRSSGVRRRLHGTLHNIPLVCVFFSRSKCVVTTLDVAGFASTHKYAVMYCLWDIQCQCQPHTGIGVVSSVLNSLAPSHNVCVAH
jgi:hypothetical protein